MAAQNGILAMHIKKAEEPSSNIGLQLPKSATILCFDDSIAYSTANVKRGMEQSLQPSRTEAEIDPGITALAADLDAFWSDYDIDNCHERFTDGLTFTVSMAADIAAGTASREWIRDTLQGILIASPDVAARSDRELRAAELLNRLQNIDERMTTMSQTPKQKQSVEPKYEYVNQDYYRSLHPHQRQVETMPQALADLFMKELKRFEVPFSAVKKPDGITMVTVDKTMHSLAISKAKDLATDAFLQQTHTVNKDYFFSIPPKQREQIILPAVQAALAMSLLQQQDVPFSALKKEDRTTITVNGAKHAAALAEAADCSQSWKQAIDGIINKEELSSIIEKGGKHIDLPSTVAIDVMKALKAANIPYGGVERNGNTMLAVAPEHQAALNQIVLESKMINPNHYQQCPSLTHSAVLPTAMAEKLMQSLDEKKIPYHGIRYKESVVVSVHSDHQAQLIDLASQVKKSQQLETINPDYFRSLPKEERFTRRMPEAEARQVVAELKEKGIQHSAVFGGRKSGVTISKADEKREGFFLGRSKRDGVHRDAAAAPKQDTPSKGVDTKNRSNDTHGL